MKKRFFIMIFLTLALVFIQSDGIKIIQGRDNLNKLKNAAPVFVVFTFNDTKLWNETLDEFVARKNKNKTTASKKVMISNFFSTAEEYSRDKGQIWEMKVVDSPRKVQGGFVFEINYNRIASVPPLAAKGTGTVIVYHSDNPNNILFKGEITSLVGWAKGKEALPKHKFSAMGRAFVRTVINFLTKDVEGVKAFQ